jgi:hypothetical protein
MTLLSLVKKIHPLEITYLPVVPSAKSRAIRNDIRDTKSVEDLTSNYELFQGIFDSAPIGMWLLGQDPRNYLGKIVRHRDLPESYVQAQEFDYSFENSLIVDEKICIYNLHVHSKELRYFSGKFQALKSRVADAKNQDHSTAISLRSYLSITRDYIKRNGLASIPKKVLSLIKS